jgi:hypothetical protein
MCFSMYCLFVFSTYFLCVNLYYCHWVSTKLQLYIYIYIYIYVCILIWYIYIFIQSKLYRISSGKLPKFEVCGSSQQCHCSIQPFGIWRSVVRRVFADNRDEKKINQSNGTDSNRRRQGCSNCRGLNIRNVVCISRIILTSTSIIISLYFMQYMSGFDFSCQALCLEDTFEYRPI